MTREQVIKAFEECQKSTCSKDCPYYDNGIELAAVCEKALMRDALALLKEQEPKQVIKQTCHIKITTGYENPVVFTSYDLLCPTCKSLLCRGVDVIDDNYHYCKVCGQAVKWE